MALQLRNHDAEYRNAVSTGFVGSLLFHLLLLALGGWLLLFVSRDSTPPILGYRGPTRFVREIDIIEPHSVQWYFHQRRREGRRRSPEYRVLERIEMSAGPDPVPVRQPDKKPDPEATMPLEDVDLVEPIIPTHREVAFSRELVIVKMVEPKYPEYELQQMIQGSVVVQVYVHTDGELSVESILRSSTTPAGHSTRAFELAALEAARQCRVLPPLVNGEPRATWHELTFNFKHKDVSP